MESIKWIEAERIERSRDYIDWMLLLHSIRFNSIGFVKIHWMFHASRGSSLRYFRFGFTGRLYD